MEDNSSGARWYFRHFLVVQIEDAPLLFLGSDLVGVTHGLHKPVDMRRRRHGSDQLEPFIGHRVNGLQTQTFRLKTGLWKNYLNDTGRAQDDVGLSVVN